MDLAVWFWKINEHACILPIAEDPEVIIVAKYLHLTFMVCHSKCVAMEGVSKMETLRSSIGSGLYVLFEPRGSLVGQMQGRMAEQC
jgi:hypothetical protein